MRAGPYAVHQGRVYRAVSLDKPRVRLLVPGDEPCPAGFERNVQGQWTRLVPREEVSLLLQVETTAVWRGYRVDVESVDAGLAQIRYFGTDFPGGPRITRFQQDGWYGTVPVDELEDVDSTAREFPL